MLEKENELLNKIGYFYQDVLGGKETAFSENMSIIVSGTLMPSFNICSIHNHVTSDDIDLLKKTWNGPMTILTNIENNFAFAKTFQGLGFMKHTSFPILYKKLENTDFDWGKKQIKDTKEIDVKRVESESDLNDFSNIISNVYNLNKSSIISSMKKNILENNNTRMYVGYHKEKPVSTVASLNHEQDSFIWSMNVVPEFRNSDIMKKMGYKMFEDNLNNNNLNTYTFTTALETEGLFKKMGAKKIGDVYLWVRL